MNYNSYETL